MIDTYSPWLEHCRKHPLLFPIVVKTDFPVMGRIYPLKQNEVNNIYQALKNMDISIWIFGSSTSNRCGIMSDLDVALKTNDEETYKTASRTISKICQGNCDVIDLNEINYDSLLFRDIWKDGVKLL